MADLTGFYGAPDRELARLEGRVEEYTLKRDKLLAKFNRRPIVLLWTQQHNKYASWRPVRRQSYTAGSENKAIARAGALAILGQLEPRDITVIKWDANTRTWSKIL